MTDKKQEIKKYIVETKSGEYALNPISLDALSADIILVDNPRLIEIKKAEFYHIGIDNILFILDESSVLKFETTYTPDKIWYADSEKKKDKKMYAVYFITRSYVTLGTGINCSSGLNYIDDSVIHSKNSCFLNDCSITQSTIRAKTFTATDTQIVNTYLTSPVVSMHQSHVTNSSISASNTIIIKNSPALHQLVIGLSEQTNELVSGDGKEAPPFDYSNQITNITVVAPEHIPFSDAQARSYFAVKDNTPLNVIIRDRFDMSPITTVNSKKFTALRVNDKEILVGHLHVTKKDINLNYEDLCTYAGTMLFNKKYDRMIDFTEFERIILNDFIESIESRLKVFEIKSGLGH